MTKHIGDLPHAIDDGEELDRHLAGRRPAVFLDYDVGCWELKSMGLVDISRCCETCYSAERYSWGGSLGPCRARVADGRPSSAARARSNCWGATRDGAARATIR